MFTQRPGIFPAPPRVGLLPTPRPATYQFFTNPTPISITRPTINIIRPTTLHPAGPQATSTVGQAPLTTVFIGNISEKVDNDVLKSILNQCGAVAQWKRIQGSNGRFQAFGFCEFEHPEGTMRALRVLNDYKLGDKKLVVKVEDKTRKMIRDFMASERAKRGETAEVLTGDQLPCDEQSIKEDALAATRIMELIKERQAELLDMDLVEEGEVKEVKKESSSSSSDSDDDDKRRSRTRSSSRRRSSRRRHSRSVSSEMRSRRRRHKRSRSSSRSSSSSDSSAGRGKRRKYSKSGSDSDASVDAEEKRRLRRIAHKKKAEYDIRVKKWEEREKRMAKQYAMDEDKELQRKRAITKEARKLKSFLEDYDDERDDPKYYKSSALFQRRRDYEREKESDAKDRLEEQKEIEELKKQIMESGRKIEEAEAEARKRHEEQEKEMLEKHREEGSPNPHIPLGQTRSVKAEAESSDEEKKDDESTSSDEDGSKAKDKGSASGWDTVDTPIESQPSPSLKQSGAPAIKLSSNIIKTNLEQVFNHEDEEEEEQKRREINIYGVKTKLKIFEITAEEREKLMTPEERKKMIKDLIDRIPTGKEDLFAYKVQWEHVDQKLVENRIQPWVNKKIRDYLGEDEPALANFIGEKIASHVEPEKLLADLTLVLDDEAEVFIVKMWRLIIYESEAKKLGLSGSSNQQPSSSRDHHHRERRDRGDRGDRDRKRDKEDRRDRDRRH